MRRWLLRYLAAGGLLALILSASGNAQEEENRARPRDFYVQAERLINHGVYSEAIRLLEEYLEENPEDHGARKLLARACEQTGDFLRLRKQAETILEKRPHDADAADWLERARQELEAQLPSQRANLEEAVSKEPGDSGLRRRLIDLLEQQQDFPAAELHYKVLLRQEPEDPSLSLRYARFLARDGRRVQAQEYYRKYLEKHSDDLAVHQEMIDTLLRQGSGLIEQELWDEADQFFRDVAERHPDDLYLRRHYARMLSWAGRYTEAIPIYEEILKQETDSELQFELASVYAWSNRPGAAVAILEALIEENEENADALSLLADVHRWNDDTDVASDLYEKALGIDPAHEAALKGVEELAALAAERRRQAERLSIPAMEEKIAADPGDQAARLQLARLLGAAGRYDQARSHFETYLQKAADEVAIRREYAIALSAREEYPEAIRQLRLYLEAHPDDVSVRLQVVNLSMWQGDLAQAEQELLVAHGLAPQYKEVHWGLGRLCQMQSRWQEALEHFGNVLQLDPQNHAARAAIAQIEANPYYRIGRLEEAIEKNSVDTAAHLELAELLAGFERYQEARLHAQAVLSLDSANQRARNILERADVAIGRARIARTAQLRKNLRQTPADSGSQLELARLLRADGNTEEAIRRYRLYLEVEPADLEVRREYSQLLVWSPEEREQAFRELRHLVSLYPNDLELRVLFFEVATWGGFVTEELAGERNKTEKEIREILSYEPDQVELRLQLARLCLLREDWTAGMAEYQAILEKNPGHAEAQARAHEIETSPGYRIARHRAVVSESPQEIAPRLELAAMLFDLERYYEAREEARVVVELDPRHAEARRLYRYATDLMQRARGGQIRDLRLHLNDQPRDLEAHLKLARLLKEDGEYAEALRRFQIYLRVHTYDLETRRQYAELLSWIEDHREEALVEFRELLAFSPDDLDLKLQYARVMTWDRTHWRSAEKQLLELAVLNPGASEVNLLLADLYRHQGRYREARELYERVLALEASDRLEAQGRLVGVQEVRKASSGGEGNSTDSVVDGATAPANRGVRSSVGNGNGKEGYSEQTPAQGSGDGRRDGERPPSRSGPSQWIPWSGVEGLLEDRSSRLSATNFDFLGPSVASESPETLPEVGSFGAPDWRTEEGSLGQAIAVGEKERASSYLFPRLAPDPVAGLPGIEAPYEEALRGLELMERELRPQLGVTLAELSDNEDYSESQLGVRYYHFLSGGTRLNFGVSRFHFRQDDSETGIERMDAWMFAFGATGRISDRMTGGAEVRLSDFDDGRTTISGTLRGTYDLTSTYDGSIEYSKYDVVHEVKTVDALAERIDADRIGFDLSATPPASVEEAEFWERVFVDAHLGLAAFSDGNRRLSYLIQPYARVRDEPNIDVIFGWRGLTYSRQSPFYWSPDSYTGPLFGVRFTGEAIDEWRYNLRFESFFPDGITGPARSVSLDLQRNFGEHLYGGVNISGSESPRADDFRYRHFGILFDLLWAF